MDQASLFDPLRGHKLNDIELAVARIIVDASRERPVMIAGIQERLKIGNGRQLSERSIKDLIRDLRQVHCLPIGSTKGTRPGSGETKATAGYWWISTPDDMKQFAEEFAAQPFDQLKTLSRVIRRNQPALVGQLRFQLPEIEEVKPCCG